MNKKLVLLLVTWRQNRQKIVLVTGVFDVLHIEHIRFLSKAKAEGDRLVVGIESDARVKQIKGHERPVNKQRVRQEQLAALRVVDEVFMLPDHFDTPADWEGLMEQVKPDVYAVSAHTSYQESKQRICKKYGIAFKIVHDFNPDYSTSKILAKLLEEIG